MGEHLQHGIDLGAEKYSCCVARMRPEPGTPVDIAEFAAVRWWTGSERHTLQCHDLVRDCDGTWPSGRDPETGYWHTGLEWQESRDIQSVIVEYGEGVPELSQVELQYWCKSWPTSAPERRPGARRGWIAEDDPWHGQWITVRAERVRIGNRLIFVFDPVDIAELGGRDAADQLDSAEHYLARFRRTLKVRLVHKCMPAPRIDCMHVFSASSWRVGTVEVRLSANGKHLANWSGRADVYNGRVISVVCDPQSGEAASGDGAEWSLTSLTEGMRVQLCVAYTDAPADSGDATIVTIKTEQVEFSFAIADLEHGPVYVPPYDVLVCWANEDVDVARLMEQAQSAPKTVYDRVAERGHSAGMRPTLSGALAGIPRLDPRIHEPYGRYLPLGVDSGRLQFALRYNGEIFAEKGDLKVGGRDTARLLWSSHLIRFRFGSGDPPDFREDSLATEQSLFDGWLPLVTSRWLDREIAYEHTAFAAFVDGPMTAPDVRNGDEEILALVKCKMRNTTAGVKRASLWLHIAPQEALDFSDGRLMAIGRVVPDVQVRRQWRVNPYPYPILRCVVRPGARGALRLVPYSSDEGTATNSALVYEVVLDEGECASIDLVIPLAGYSDPYDWDRVCATDFEEKRADVVRYWREYAVLGAEIVVPDQEITDFVKAVRTHIAISVDKDPDSSMYVVPAATWRYGACGNEACWQIQMLDQMGYHDRAEVYLDTFLKTQGSMLPDGLFSSSQGALQGLDLDFGKPQSTRFGYNLDHGYIMECLANHYLLTGDETWLLRAAPHLVEACGFISRERETTKTVDSNGRHPAGWGLLPPGHLEDNEDWKQWFAVNAHAYAGMCAAAEVLRDIDHPEALRLEQEAQAYVADIRRAVHRSMVESPVVQLRDGTFIPRIPPRVGIRGRERGWFREVAYGAIQLLEGRVLPPDDPRVTWILQDIEDNLLVSREWGFPVDVEKDWFSRGGVAPQPNLLDLAVDYLRREQPEHALRVFFNSWAASIYPDVLCFAEWIPAFGEGGGPFFKTPDEARWVSWLCALLLSSEEDSLRVGAGIPRYWLEHGKTVKFERLATRFGTADCTWNSSLSSGYVDVLYEPPVRKVPGETVLYIRQPGALVARTIECSTHDARVIDCCETSVALGQPTEPVSLRVYFEPVG